MSNFFLQSSKVHRFEEYEADRLSNEDLRKSFIAYRENMVEVLKVVQSSFKLMVHAKLAEEANSIHMQNRMLSYADAIEGGYEEDKVKIEEDASKKTKKQIESEGFDDERIINYVEDKLSKLENDSTIRISSFATLRQSIVIIWSATESLLRDVFSATLNSDNDLAARFFESSETNRYWSSKQISYEHIKGFGFNLNSKMGDVALEINGCSNQQSLLVAYGFLFGRDSEIYKNIRSRNFFILYKLRNIIAHRNGIVDEKYKRETQCNDEIGDRVKVLPENSTECYSVSKNVAYSLLQELLKKQEKE